MQSGEPTLCQFWGVWALLTNTDRKIASFDDICLVAKVKPDVFMASLIGTAVRHNADVARMTASSFEPHIVEQMGKSALRIDGDFADIAQRDRMAMMQKAGHVPVPRNASVSVNVNATASAAAKAAAAATADPSMPDFLDDMQSLQGPKESIQKALIGEVVDDEYEA